MNSSRSKKTKFEISKVFVLRFTRYRDGKIRVCGKNLIPLNGSEVFKGWLLRVRPTGCPTSNWIVLKL